MARRTLSRLASTMARSREPGVVRPSLICSVQNRASSSARVQYRSSLQVMIFVIRFLLFVARPRRSGPFLRPGEIIVRERPAGGGRSGSIRRKREKEEHCRCGIWDHTLATRAGDCYGGKI